MELVKLISTIKTKRNEMGPVIQEQKNQHQTYCCLMPSYCQCISKKCLNQLER